MVWCIQQVSNSSVHEKIRSCLKFKMSIEMLRTWFISVRPDFRSYAQATKYPRSNSRTLPKGILWWFWVCFGLVCDQKAQADAFWMLAQGWSHKNHRKSTHHWPGLIPSIDRSSSTHFWFYSFETTGIFAKQAGSAYLTRDIVPICLVPRPRSFHELL